MTTSPQPKPTQVSLDELGQLCDEIAALSRAGVPLEGGLGGLARDLPGRLGRFAGYVAERMRAGDTLAAAIAASGMELPAYLRAAIEAGLRSGRLSAALEGVAGSLRRVAELRRGVGTALVYPFVVLIFAYCLLVFMAVEILPVFARTHRGLEFPATGFLDGLVRFGTASPWVLLAPPVLFGLIFGAWWWATGRWALGNAPWTRAALALWPGMLRVQLDSRAAVEADVLALLVEHDVPLPEAIELAAEATGDARHQRAGAVLAASLRRGESLAAASREVASDAGVVRWMLLAGERRESLVAALHHAAAGYERRAVQRAELVRVWFPFLATIVVGGGAVLGVGLALWLPFVRMLEALAL